MTHFGCMLNRCGSGTPVTLSPNLACIVNVHTLSSVSALVQIIFLSVVVVGQLPQFDVKVVML